jgi:hypothetical protein
VVRRENLVDLLVLDRVRAARRGCRAEFGEERSGEVGVKVVYAWVSVRSCLRRSLGSWDGVVGIGLVIWDLS